jgi:hypothetical protein
MENHAPHRPASDQSPSRSDTRSARPADTGAAASSRRCGTGRSSAWCRRKTKLKEMRKQKLDINNISEIDFEWKQDTTRECWLEIRNVNARKRLCTGGRAAVAALPHERVLVRGHLARVGRPRVDARRAHEILGATGRRAALDRHCVAHAAPAKVGFRAAMARVVIVRVERKAVHVAIVETAFFSDAFVRLELVDTETSVVRVNNGSEI